MSLRTHIGEPARLQKGRGAALNVEGRFETTRREIIDDGWFGSDLGEASAKLDTHVTEERARSIITRNASPDIPFTLSINPYRGCEHGCIYCYARPSHAYLDLSPGLDFETRLYAKTNAAALLREELARPKYQCESIALGTNTDPYQPIERDYRITRQILELLAQCDHPASIVTKNALVLRDLDVLVPMARKNLMRVYISVTTLDHSIARRLEPRASSPTRRLEAIQALHEAGVPVGVMVAPVIPFLTDDSLERVLEAAAKAGARYAGYVLLRLPYEIKELFKDWLKNHYPLKAEHVMSRVREMRAGRENDPEFGSRMRGQGLLAQLLAQRFDKACARLQLNQQQRGGNSLDKSLFKAPVMNANQMTLF